MSFNDDARLDPSQVQDQRGGGGRFGRGTLIGGGIGGTLLVIVLSLLGVNPQLLEGLTGQAPSGQEQTGPGSAAECRTGASADARVDCRIVGTVNSLNAFWADYLPERGVRYPQPDVVIFDQGVSTGCGTATSEVGPFYCPADTTAYFDPGFFEVLETQFGASSGPLAQEYVVAHEFGHHIQNIIGTLGYAQQDPQGPQSGAVRVELQADCLAGIWAQHADSQPAPGSGEPFLEPLTQQDLRDALSAAAAVGDDRIQRAATGRVNPEAWTHGSAEQRQAWFTRGYESGDIDQCNTLTGRV